MSGFEIVGLILASFSAIDLGLRAYRNRRLYREYSDVIEDLSQSLQIQQTLFRELCERLLADLMDHIEVVEALDLLDSVDESARQRWKTVLNDGLEAEVRERLGDRYDDCTQTMQRIARRIATMTNELGLREDLAGAQTSSNGSRQSWKSFKAVRRLKKCVDVGKHEKLLAKIRDGIDDLEKLSPKDTPEIRGGGGVGFRMGRSETRIMSKWESIKDSATSLFDALSSEWCCACTQPHPTRVRLYQPTIWEPDTQQHFNMWFKRPGSNLNSAIQEQWEPAEFACQKIDGGGQSRNTAMQTRSQARNPRGNENTHTGGGHSTKVVTNLCAALLGQNRNARRAVPKTSAPECIGYMASERYKHYVFHDKNTYQIPASRSNLCLADFLSAQTTNPPTPRQIGLSERLELSLLLAVSIMQLRTSWLDRKWTTGDVQVMFREKNIPLNKCICLAQSYPCTSNMAVNNQNSFPLRQQAIPNEAIFALGTVMVELATNSPLTCQEIEDDREYAALADWKTADRLRQQFAAENTPEWNQVVYLCVGNKFPYAPDFEKKEFRHFYFKNVIMPLRKMVQNAKSD